MDRQAALSKVWLRLLLLDCVPGVLERVQAWVRRKWLRLTRLRLDINKQLSAKGEEAGDMTAVVRREIAASPAVRNGGR